MWRCLRSVLRQTSDVRASEMACVMHFNPSLELSKDWSNITLTVGLIKEWKPLQQHLSPFLYIHEFLHMFDNMRQILVWKNLYILANMTSLFPLYSLCTLVSPNSSRRLYSWMVVGCVECCICWTTRESIPDSIFCCHVYGVEYGGICLRGKKWKRNKQEAMFV